MYTLRFKKSVAKDLKRIGKKDSRRILTDIREKLLPNPRCGKPLKGQDGVIWSHRIGDFRVLYTFSDHELYVLVIRIAHRKEVYRDL